MAFLIFEEAAFEGHRILRQTGQTFKLAGYTLLHKAWEKRGKPLNVGWHVTHEDLIRLHYLPQQPRDDVRMMIDFHPTSTGRNWSHPDH